MEILSTPFEGLFEIVPKIHHDDRGWFFELHRTDKLRDAGLPHKFQQANQSFSKAGVVRGLHLQHAPHAQTKLVTVQVGKCLDVVVDLRPESNTFGKSYRCELSDSTRKMLLVPEGFAHGFVALTDCLFYYQCSNLYNSQAESGIVWNDATLNIDWGIENPIVSAKDRALPTFDEFVRKSVLSR